MKEYDIILLERPLDKGITKDETIRMFEMLSGTEAIPIEIEAEFSSAMGFINLTDAALINYDYEQLECYIRSILEDMKKENIDQEYTFPNKFGESDIWLGRNLPELS